MFAIAVLLGPAAGDMTRRIYPLNLLPLLWGKTVSGVGVLLRSYRSNAAEALWSKVIRKSSI